MARDRLAAGTKVLRGLGFEPVLAENSSATSPEGLFAGSDEERLEGLYRLTDDESIRAVVFARGGHGLLRLLPQIDWQRLARHPRAYVGYSDLTPFLLQVPERLGLVAFHGPMVAADLARGLSAAEAEDLLGALGGAYPRRLEGLRTLRQPASGEAAVGPLVGGCLSMLVALLGTPYFPSLDGVLLFLEDVNEPLYRLDRMLTHLRLSGNVSRLSGLVLGHFSHSEGAPDWPERWWRLVEDSTRELGWPLMAGLQCGHEAPNMTLPVGLRTALDRHGGLILG